MAREKGAPVRWKLLGVAALIGGPAAATDCGGDASPQAVVGGGAAGASSAGHAGVQAAGTSSQQAGSGGKASGVGGVANNGGVAVGGKASATGGAGGDGTGEVRGGAGGGGQLAGGAGGAGAGNPGGGAGGMGGEAGAPEDCPGSGGETFEFPESCPGLPARTGWVASASTFSGSSCNATGEDTAAKAIDENRDTRWSTGKLQDGSEWFQLDFGQSATFDGVFLDNIGSDSKTECNSHCFSLTDYPRHYQVRVSNVSQNFGAPVLKQGSGHFAHTWIQLDAPVTGRYLLLRQTETSNSDWWAIRELTVTCKK